MIATVSLVNTVSTHTKVLFLVMRTFKVCSQQLPNTQCGVNTYSSHAVLLLGMTLRLDYRLLSIRVNHIPQATVWADINRRGLSKKGHTSE